MADVETSIPLASPGLVDLAGLTASGLGKLSAAWRVEAHNQAGRVYGMSVGQGRPTITAFDITLHVESRFSWWCGRSLEVQKGTHSCQVLIGASSSLISCGSAVHADAQAKGVELRSNVVIVASSFAVNQYSAVNAQRTANKQPRPHNWQPFSSQHTEIAAKTPFALRQSVAGVYSDTRCGSSSQNVAPLARMRFL